MGDNLNIKESINIANNNNQVQNLENKKFNFTKSLIIKQDATVYWKKLLEKIN